MLDESTASTPTGRLRLSVEPRSKLLTERLTAVCLPSMFVVGLLSFVDCTPVTVTKGTAVLDDDDLCSGSGRWSSVVPAATALTSDVSTSVTNMFHSVTNINKSIERNQSAIDVAFSQRDSATAVTTMFTITIIIIIVSKSLGILDTEGIKK